MNPPAAIAGLSAGQCRPKNNDRVRNLAAQKLRFFQICDAEKLASFASALATPTMPCPYPFALTTASNSTPRANPFAHQTCVVTQRTLIDFSPASVSRFGIH